MKAKRRLDILLLERQLARSRSQAAALIMAAQVFVDERLIDKPGAQVSSSAQIRLKERPRFVSRGGIKLEAALTEFDLEARGKICADVGASSGGFTDCLLQWGAKRVYAIDVGAGLIDYRLRIDDRVRLLEKTNARHLRCLGESIDLAVIDVSFISLRLILPAVQGWLKDRSDVVALVKPQFEAGKAEVGKGGIVRDPAIHQRVLLDTARFAQEQGYSLAAVMRSPIMGRKGNAEFLMWLRLGCPDLQRDLEDLIMPVFAGGGIDDLCRPPTPRPCSPLGPPGFRGAEIPQGGRGS